jgi:hypothetical protein
MIFSDGITVKHLVYQLCEIRKKNPRLCDIAMSCFWVLKDKNTVVDLFESAIKNSGFHFYIEEVEPAMMLLVEHEIVDIENICGGKTFKISAEYRRSIFNG